MYFSKSQYLKFKQCEKSLWLYRNKVDLCVSLKDNLLDRGKRVGKVARNLFKNGKEIQYDSAFKMISETEKLIKSGEKTIYEAAFLYDDVLVMCDILHNDGRGWNIYEVKSSTHINKRYIDDISMQYYVVSNNMNIKSINIIYINNKYIRKDRLNLKELFNIKNMTYEAKKNIYTIPNEIKRMREITKDKEPEIDIGLYCEKYGKLKFECDFKHYCWRHIPQYSVFNIGGLRKEKRYKLYNSGIVKIKDIPNNYKLSKNQSMQVKALKENTKIIEKDKIKTFLNKLKYPLYFLDFETFQQTVPEFKGLKPYQHIPFQYSLHILDKNNNLIHKEFLGKEGIDPRRNLAQRLVKDIPKNMCTIAYNMCFEKRVLKDLSTIYPDLKEHLMNIHDNMKDLMEPFKYKYYYTNEMKGSYSIKYVLPALCPNNDELDYNKLDIQNGVMAMNTFEILHLKSPNEIQKIRENLLAYCKLDTLAMVRILEKLYKV